MPNGYDITKIKVKDFEAALQVLIAELEEHWKGQRGPVERIMRNLPFGIGPEDVDDAADRIYDEIMRAVTKQGISPYIAQVVSPEAAQIFNQVVQLRSLYPSELEYKEQVQKQAALDWDREFSQMQWQQAEAWRRYNAGIQQQQMQWQQQQAQQQWKQTAQEQMWANWQAQQNLLGQQYGLAAQRMAAWNQPTELVAEEEKYRIFEAARAEIASGLSGARNQFKLWEVENKPNPYRQQGLSMEEEVARTKEEVKRYKEAANVIQKRMKDPEDPLYLPRSIDDPNVQLSAEQWRAAEILSRLKTAENKLVEFVSSPEYAESREWATPRPTAMGGYEVGRGGIGGGVRPATPVTPEWLRKFYPDMPARVEKREPVIPSGQLWTSLSPSEREGYWGYVEWAGGVPEDVAWQAERALPQPRRGTAWQPYRQRVSV